MCLSERKKNNFIPNFKYESMKVSSFDLKFDDPDTNFQCHLGDLFLSRREYRLCAAFPVRICFIGNFSPFRNSF